MKYYKERALFSLTRDVVNVVNDFVLSLIPSAEKEYLSSDSIVISDENSLI